MHVIAFGCRACMNCDEMAVETRTLNCNERDIMSTHLIRSMMRPYRTSSFWRNGWLLIPFAPIWDRNNVVGWTAPGCHLHVCVGPHVIVYVSVCVFVVLRFFAPLCTCTYSCVCLSMRTGACIWVEICWHLQNIVHEWSSPWSSVCLNRISLQVCLCLWWCAVAFAYLTSFSCHLFTSSFLVFGSWQYEFWRSPRKEHMQRRIMICMIRPFGMTLRELRRESLVQILLKTIWSNECCFITFTLPEGARHTWCFCLRIVTSRPTGCKSLFTCKYGSVTY